MITKICKTCNKEKDIKEFREGLLSCKKCNALKYKKKSREYSSSDRGKKILALSCKKWREKTNYFSSEKYKKRKKAYRAKKQVIDRTELNRHYVYVQLYNKGFTNEQITDELIELQKIIIKTKRLCKTLKN